MRKWIYSIPGAALVVAGVGWQYPPAAVVIAGVFLLVAAMEVGE